MSVIGVIERSKFVSLTEQAAEDAGVSFRTASELVDIAKAMDVLPSGKYYDATLKCGCVAGEWVLRNHMASVDEPKAGAVGLAVINKSKAFAEFAELIDLYAGREADTSYDDYDTGNPYIKIVDDTPVTV